MIPSGIRNRTIIAAAGALMLSLCCGCSTPASRDAASLLFDGVPALPVPEVYCESWLKAQQVGAGPASKVGKTPAVQGSSHPPYVAKQCNDCHDTTKEGGLVAPKNELCFLCHEDIVKKAVVHAPAATGDCLACHLPHNSDFPYLLKMDKAKLCDTCHAEQRQAPGLHTRVSKAGILCIDCHNPHAGSARYFLK